MIISAILCLASSKKKDQVICSFFIMLLMLLVCGFRSVNVGIDTIYYVDSFIYGLDDYFVSFGGLLFNLTYEIVHLFSSSWQAWLFFSSILIYVPLFIVLKSSSPLPALSMFLYMISVSHFFPETMNIIRQAIASSFLLGAYYVWNKGNIIGTMILIAVAVMFHITSLIAIPFLFLKYVRFNKTVIIICLLTLLVLGLFGNITFNDEIIRIGELFVGSDQAQYVMKYTKYVDSVGANWKGYLAGVSPLIILCLITIPISKEGEKYRYYYNILFVGTIIYSFLSSVDYSFRIIYGQIIIQLLVIPFAYKYGNLIQKQLIIIFVCVCIILFYLYLVQQENSLLERTIVPYSTSLDLF